MKKFCLMLAALSALMLSGCAASGEGQIVATSFPCYDFARQVAGDAAQVKMLIRPGAEVHSYEPSPSDILDIGGADLFVYIGGESDVWVDGILDSLGSGAPRSVKLMDAATLLQEDHGGEDGQDHAEMDEHIWTSPKNAEKMLRAVEEALCEAMPEQAETFRANADAYAGQIAQLDADLTALVAGSARRELVFADRFPFLYLAHDYGLTYSAAFASCTSETEPSAQTMVRLIQTIQEEKIPAVYIIELSNGAIARTLSEETGVEVLEMHSCQTVTQQEFDAGESYVSLMRRNLEAMRRGLN